MVIHIRAKPLNSHSREECERGYGRRVFGFGLIVCAERSKMFNSIDCREIYLCRSDSVLFRVSSDGRLELSKLDFDLQ